MSEFFSVNTSANIIVDDGTITRSTVWSSEQTYEAITNYVAANGSGGGFKYMEINDVITLDAGQTIQRDYDLGENSMIVTTVYLDIADGSNLQFKVADKVTNGFLLYDTGRVSHYTDSLFIPYKDKEPTTVTTPTGSTIMNKLHTEITNWNLNAPVVLNLKILGLECDI